MALVAARGLLNSPCFVLIARVDHNETIGSGEERPHVSVEHRVLDQVVNGVERQDQIKAAEVRW
jgi:hypothetical protein